MSCLSPTHFAIVGVVIIVVTLLVLLAVLAKSQREKEMVPNHLLKLAVVVSMPNGTSITDVTPCNSIEEAQDALNVYMFHCVVKATLHHSNSGRIYAVMDHNGVLRARPAN